MLCLVISQSLRYVIFVVSEEGQGVRGLGLREGLFLTSTRQVVTSHTTCAKQKKNTYQDPFGGQGRICSAPMSLGAVMTD